MRKKNNGKDAMALCHIYKGLTYEQEAELYYKLDQAKGHLRLSHATKALVESGSNAEVTEINRLLEDAGFIWALDKPTKEPFEIEATRAVINAYRLLGGAAFSRMLGLLAKTWANSPVQSRLTAFWSVPMPPPPARALNDWIIAQAAVFVDSSFRQNRRGMDFTDILGSGAFFGLGDGETQNLFAIPDPLW